MMPASCGSTKDPEPETKPEVIDDPFLDCPYDSKHRVPRSRIQSHIVRCQQKHPKLHICPYNATHRMSERELEVHVNTCPTRMGMIEEKKKVTGFRAITPKPLFQQKYLPETDPNHEMWDD